MYSTVTLDIVTVPWTAFLTALFGSFIPAIRAAMLSPVNAMKRYMNSRFFVLGISLLASALKPSQLSYPMLMRSLMPWTSI